MAGEKIVVLDIGKTNKKLFVYDSSLTCLNPEEKGVRINPLRWTPPAGPALECEDMASIREWMLEGLKKATAEHGDIGAVSISAHGATVALLGGNSDEVFQGDGGLVFPVVSYENDIPDAMEKEFYRQIGMDPLEAQEITATPRLSWLTNCAKTVFYLRQNMPERFGRVTDILMLPQYLGYLLCGEMGVEPTYIGCHSYLLDVSGSCYSRVAENLGVVDLLPELPIGKTWDKLGTVSADIASATGLRRDCVVTMGAHDSNAALVPYLAKGLENFVVQDSGTWVVTMAPLPGGEAEFTDEELGLEVLFNRDIYGDPVKTTIFRGGAEFEFYQKNVLKCTPHTEDVCEQIVNEIIDGQNAFSLPTVERGAGLFPGSIARLVGIDKIFRDAATAWHVIDIGLAIQGYHALRLAAGASPERIYIEGNIARHNPLYRRVIRSLFADTRVYYGSMGGAPFGAAILGLAAIENVRPEVLSGRYEMELREVNRLGVDTEALISYAETFLAQVSSGGNSPSQGISG